MVIHSNIRLSCYQIQFASNFICLFTVIFSWKKLGSIDLYHCGHVESGFWRDALVCEEAHSQNDDPEACNTGVGVIRLKTTFAKFSIQNSEKRRIVCFGKGYQILKPGLSNNP
jgi:hypothetical protein